MIKRIIEGIKNIIKRNKIEYYQTNVIEDKQSFAIKINGTVIMMEGKIDKINGFDFPYKANELKIYNDNRIWNKIKKKEFKEEYKGSKETIKQLIKVLKKESR